jgi:hypothetical protein
MIRYHCSLNCKQYQFNIIFINLNMVFNRNLNLISGGVLSQGWNLKELTDGHHQEWNLRLNLTQHGKSYQVKTQLGLTDYKIFLNFVGGGAWPFLVGEVICLVNSVNERDLNLLNIWFNHFLKENLYLNIIKL